MKAKASMQLTDSEVREFQQLYQETFGHEISREEAIRSGGKLIRLLQILYPNPIAKEEFDRLVPKDVQ